MRRLIAICFFVFTVFSFAALPAFAGSGSVMKKGTQTVVVWQSVSDPDKHWIERNGYRSKKSGSAKSAIRKYRSRGYKKTGSQSW